MSIYDIREMMEAINLTIPMQLFFTKFFNTHNTHLAEVIEFDVKKGRRALAPFVAPRVGGKVMTRDGFQTKSVKTPKIAPERHMTTDDIVKRGLGENIYSQRRPEERAMQLLAEDLNFLEETITHRKEWMARQIILSGRIDVQDPDEGVDFVVDYGFTNKTTLIGAAKWNEETADPIKNMKVWRRVVINKTGRAPIGAIMGCEAFEAFKNNKSVKEAFNIRNMHFGEIKPHIVDRALTFCGRLPELNLDIYTYDEWFINDDGKEEAMLPGNTVMLLPEEIGSFEHGSVTLITDDSQNYQTFEGRLVPQVIVDSKNSIKIVRMTSRPLPRPYDVDSWYIAEVV